MNDQFNLEKTTYYVLDATGNVMATYDKEIDYTNSKVYFKLKDRSIYGSSRVGVRSTDIDMLALHNPNYSMKSVKYEIGKRTYELSNHLGNVLSVISDKPIPSFEYEELAGMLADVRVAQDYSPFGVTWSGRSFDVDGGYSYSFQGQEHDDEIKGKGNSVNYKYRMHDPRLGRLFDVDPLSPEYPWNSPYAFSENIVIDHIELEGLEKADNLGKADLNSIRKPVSNPNLDLLVNGFRKSDIKPQTKLTYSIDKKDINNKGRKIGGSDYSGKVQNATQADYDNNYGKALVKDISADIINNITPFGAIDDAIVVANDENANITQKIEAWVPVILTTKGGVKTGGTKAPSKLRKGDVIDIEGFKPRKDYSIVKENATNSGAGGHGGHRNPAGGSAYKFMKGSKKLYSLDKTVKIFKSYKK